MLRCVQQRETDEDVKEFGSHTPQVQSVLRRSLHVIDCNDFDWPPRGFQLEAKLFLNSREDRDTCRIGSRWSDIRCRISLQRLVTCEFQMNVEGSGERRFIEHGPSHYISKNSRQFRNWNGSAIDA